MSLPRLKALFLTGLILAVSLPMSHSAQAADGTLGESSSGPIYISLEIESNDLGPLSSEIVSELRARSSASFPVCK